MAIGDALSKITKYQDIIDMVKLRAKLQGDEYVKDSLLIKEISLATSKWAKILSNAAAPYYSVTTTIANSITGTSNPYTLDLSGVSPFFDRIIRVVYVQSRSVVCGTTLNSPSLTSTASFVSSDVGKMASGSGIPSGTTIIAFVSTSEVTMSNNATASDDPVTVTITRRVRAKQRNLKEAEDDQLLSNLNATALWYTDEGDSLKFYAGSSFTITIASDDVEIEYYRQAKTASVTAASYIDIPDAYVPVIVSEVTVTGKEYKGLDTTREREALKNYYTEIMNTFSQPKDE